MPKPCAIPAAIPSAPLRVNASLPLMIRLEEVVGYDSSVRDPANVEEIHALRIAVKRLRYTLEVFSSVIEDADGLLKTMKVLQELLGAIHDADVLIPLLEDGIARDGHTPGVRSLHTHALADRARLYGEFIRTWDEALQNSFPNRLWNAALAASSTLNCRAQTVAPADGQLPPVRRRRAHMAAAMMRLVPYAITSATPERTRRLECAMEDVREAVTDPATDAKTWRKITRQLGELITPSDN